MAIDKLIVRDWSGALGLTHEKKDVSNASKFQKNVDPFEDPSYLTLARATSKVSGSTVDNLVHWAVDASPWATDRYFYAANGKIFKETSGGTWSSERTVSGGGGEGLLVFDNGLYYAQDTELGRYYPLDNSPSFQDSFSGWWIASQLQTPGGGTGATDYSPGSSIDEGATHRQTFEADHDPVDAITIDVDVVGTGDWTVTLHNTANDSLGAETITNGNMSTGDVKFTFDNPVRVIPGEEYHFHVTTSDSTGGVDTDTASDLEGAEFTVDYETLISADFHPMVEFLNGFAIGNERYIGYFDNATFDPNKIILPPGFEVRTLTKNNEFIIAGCWRGPSFKEAEEARIYFWDGISPTFNFFTDVTVGAPNVLHNSKNRIFGIYGNKGSVFLGNEPFEQIIDRVPKLAKGKRVEVYPGATTEYEGRTLFGVSAVTDDGSNLEQGIFEYGSQDQSLPEVMNFPYTISTDTTQGTTLKIGMVKAFGEDLYIGWRDSSTYGVDKITAGDNAASSGSWESLIFDNGNPDKDKLITKLTVTAEPLATGESITPKYKIDRAGSFTTGTKVTAGSAVRAEEQVNKRFKELEFGVDIDSTSNTFPKVTSIELEYNDLAEEMESD